MTLLELPKILGDEIKAVMDGTADTDKAKAIAGLAKQMINNADIVLRTDKFVNNKWRVFQREWCRPIIVGSKLKEFWKDGVLNE